MTHLRPLSFRLAALAALLAVAPAWAADLDDGEFPPIRERGTRPDWPPPAADPSGPAGGCRVFLKRGPGRWGEDEVRRIRVCDEGPVRREIRPGWSMDHGHDRPPVMPEDLADE